MREKKKGAGENRFSLYFLAAVALLYLVLLLFRPDQIQRSLQATGHLLVRIIPIFLLVIFCMGIMNYFISPKNISEDRLEVRRQRFRHQGMAVGHHHRNTQSWFHLRLVSSITRSSKAGHEKRFDGNFPVQQGHQDPPVAADGLLLRHQVCGRSAHFYGHRLHPGGESHRNLRTVSYQATSTLEKEICCGDALLC
jgi:hypothetical protein